MSEFKKEDLRDTDLVSYKTDSGKVVEFTYITRRLLSWHFGQHPDIPFEAIDNERIVGVCADYPEVKFI